ncbi:hypothetical protein [Lentzea sp. CA-135723]|uniref:hypothetical protein n=1 Tax=Lentzea sp. CA-135723 TaxID=3239950 RepID=UPI003D9061CE
MTPMTAANKTPGFDDDGDEIGREAARGVHEIEQHLLQTERLIRMDAVHPESCVHQGQTPAKSNANELGADLSVDDELDAPLPPAAYGLTDTVVDLEIEVAEGERLKALYARRVALDLDSRKVLEKRLAGQEAEKLHVLNQLPAVRALQAATALRVFTIAALVSLTLALAWSTFGVHGFAAGDAAAWTLDWISGWFVEPFLSLGLLSIVGAKAFLAIRGHHVRSRTLNRIEGVFLLLTLGMNIYPTLPAPVGRAVKFEISDLVLHSLGPIVAVSIVRALPILWEEFSRLNHAIASDAHQAVKPEIRHDTATSATAEAGYGPVEDAFEARVTELTEQARRLISQGSLAADAKAYKIRAALEVGMNYAIAVRARLDRDA